MNCQACLSSDHKQPVPSVQRYEVDGIALYLCASHAWAWERITIGRLLDAHPYVVITAEGEQQVEGIN